MMAHHDESDSDSNTNGVAAVEQDEKCPMSCCMQASSTSATPASLNANAAPLLLSQTITLFEPQVFTATGFSSHADRGPPSIF
jgi:hypothetical protein